MNGFKKFLFRGNLIDLAVAVVIGVAFNTVVHALVNDLITPLIAAVGGQRHFFGNLALTVNGSPLKYGDFINQLLSFAVIAAVVYYLIVAPAARIAALADRRKVATERDCPECLSAIPVAAHRCKFCAAQVVPVAG